MRENEIVTVGRLENAKNQKMLIQAFSVITKNFPELVLKIYGEGTLQQELQEEINHLGLADKAFLMGKTSKVAEAIAKARIFVLPSNVEGMPNALIEAMCLGLPVVSTDCPCGGPRALIQEGKNGILVPVGNVHSLVQALMKILKDRDLEERLGNEAHKILDIYSPDKVYESWKTFIESRMQERII